jgi:hypothetical protein
MIDKIVIVISHGEISEVYTSKRIGNAVVRVIDPSSTNSPYVARDLDAEVKHYRGKYTRVYPS